MPTFSVTAIGLAGGLAALLQRVHPVGPALGRGVVGAWVGFILGGVVGVVIDAVTHNGIFLAYLGHLGALAGTVWLVRSRDPRWPVRLRRGQGGRRC